jgi:two-component system sensor histidine kinase YesM
MKFFPIRIRRLSFKSKLFLSYLLIVLIPISISAGWIYEHVLVPIRAERLQVIENNITQIKQTIDREADDIEKTGFLISTNIVLKKALLKRYYDDSEIIDVMNTSINSLISWFQATQKGNGKFHFFTGNETLPGSEFFIPVSLISGQPWYQDMTKQIKTKFPYWEKLHTQRNYPYSIRSNQNIYSMFYPINEDFENDTSYLEFEIDTNQLFNSLNSFNLLQTGFMLSIDWDHKIVWVPKKLDIIGKDIVNETAFQQIHLDKESTGNLVYKGNTYRYIVKPLERLQSSIVGFVPSNEIDGPSDKTKNVFIVLILLLTVLLAIISYLLAGLLIKKIVRIVNNVRKIQNGNFQVIIPVDGEDEIDWLATNINTMTRQIHDLIDTVYNSQVSQKEAELKALQAQINPHFLFNTLETLRMMAEIRDQTELSDALTALGSIMRYNINNGQESSTLETELEHIVDYIKIQNLHYNKRISFNSSIPEHLRLFPMPNLLLQPLVENCIIHGMKDFSGQMKIEISIDHEVEDGSLRIIVRDNGRGISLERLEQICKKMNKDLNMHLPLTQLQDKTSSKASSGVGLTNVRDRLRYFYGEYSTIEVISEIEKGTSLLLTIRGVANNSFFKPLREGSGDA